jgi:hypothetical protein
MLIDLRSLPSDAYKAASWTYLIHQSVLGIAATP